MSRKGKEMRKHREKKCIRTKKILRKKAKNSEISKRHKIAINPNDQKKGKMKKKTVNSKKKNQIQNV